MAKIELTVRQIKNLGLWQQVCEYKGYDPYIYKEGRISDEDTIEFDDEFEKEEEESINAMQDVHEDLMGKEIIAIEATEEDGKIEKITLTVVLFDEYEIGYDELEGLYVKKVKGY